MQFPLSRRSTSSCSEAICVHTLVAPSSIQPVLPLRVSTSSTRYGSHCTLSASINHECQSYVGQHHAHMHALQTACLVVAHLTACSKRSEPHRTAQTLWKSGKWYQKGFQNQGGSTRCACSSSDSHGSGVRVCIWCAASGRATASCTSETGSTASSPCTRCARGGASTCIAKRLHVLDLLSRAVCPCPTACTSSPACTAAAASVKGSIARFV